MEKETKERFEKARGVKIIDEKKFERHRKITLWLALLVLIIGLAYGFLAGWSISKDKYVDYYEEKYLFPIADYICKEKGDIDFDVLKLRSDGTILIRCVNEAFIIPNEE